MRGVGGGGFFVTYREERKRKSLFDFLFNFIYIILQLAVNRKKRKKKFSVTS